MEPIGIAIPLVIGGVFAAAVVYISMGNGQPIGSTTETSPTHISLNTNSRYMGEPDEQVVGGTRRRKGKKNKRRTRHSARKK